MLYNYELIEEARKEKRLKYTAVAAICPESPSRTCGKSSLTGEAARKVWDVGKFIDLCVSKGY